MTEDELRALVRDAIATYAAGPENRGVARTPIVVARAHVSHGLFALPEGADVDGPCLIEPAVPCNHCGYCKSLGH